MKIGVLCNVFNEASWLRCALDSVVDWADEVVIVEGSYKIAVEAGAPLRSDDGTLDILDTYRARSNVTIVYENERDEAQQLQKGLEILKDKKVDWYLLVDADEVWEQTDLKIIKQAIIKAEHSGIYQYRVNFYNFINSFDKYYDAKMKRIFKLTPGAIAVGQNGLAWPDHGKQCDVGSYAPHISELAMVRCYHYTEIKPAERWLLKKRYLKVRDGNPRFDKWFVTKDGFVNDEKDIKKFTKKHPLIIKSSPLYKLWEQDPELLRKELFDDR